MSATPRVSTRGYYDLGTGRTLKSNRYYLYPKRAFARLAGSRELVIMVHGLRNDSAGAAAKAVIARRRLRKLGYGHPVVGFSYDSNTTGAHLIRHARRALRVGEAIARKNGKHLGGFVEDFKRDSPDARIRLMGHSLGSQVILSALEYLARRGQSVEAVYLFGASIPSDAPSRYGRVMQQAVRKKILNYYAPTDEVLGWADRNGHVDGPLGLGGARGRTPKKYSQRMVRPRNHRFASYAATLGSFP